MKGAWEYEDQVRRLRRWAWTWGIAFAVTAFLFGVDLAVLHG